MVGRKPMAGTDNEVFPILDRSRMLFYCDQTARMQRGGIAVDDAAMVHSLFGLETEAGQFLSLVFLVVFARIVINFEFCMGVFLRTFRWRQQILLWVQIVVIVELDFSGAKPALRNPVVQVLLSPKFALGEGYERYLREIRN